MSILLTNDNPLEFPDYFLGPVETIAYSQSALASRRLSLHDITEAYHTLSTRIRRSSSALIAGTGTFPALEPLKQKGADVVTALRRDISRSLHDFAPHTSEDSFSSLADPTEESVGWDRTTYNKSRAADLSTLCHHALRLLSEIFRLPTLSSVFSGTSLDLWFKNRPEGLPSARSRLPSRRRPFHRSLSSPSIFQCIEDYHPRVLDRPNSSPSENHSISANRGHIFIPEVYS